MNLSTFYCIFCGFFRTTIRSFNSIFCLSFHFSLPGRPFALQNCTVSNQSIETIHVECIEGFDGGLPQMFLLEMVEIPTLKLVRNLTLYVSLKIISPRFSLNPKILFSATDPTSVALSRENEISKAARTVETWFRWRLHWKRNLFCHFYLPKTRNNLFGQFLCVFVREDWKLFQQFNRVFKFSRAQTLENKFCSPQKLFQINLFMKIHLSKVEIHFYFLRS